MSSSPPLSTKAPPPLTGDDFTELANYLRRTADYWTDRKIGDVHPAWDDDDAECATYWCPRFAALADLFENSGDPADVDRYGPYALWRGLTSVDLDSLSASLSLLDEVGTVHRFRLSEASLAAMSNALVEALRAHERRRTLDHSDRSSGSPASDGSSPQEGKNV